MTPLTIFAAEHQTIVIHRDEVPLYVLLAPLHSITGNTQCKSLFA